MAEKRLPEVDDSWQTTSGLVDDFDCYIKSARWGFRQEYQNGEVLLLIMEGESPDVDMEQPIIWPAGKGWEVRDGGDRAVHPKRSKFVDVSMYGRLLNRVVKDLGVDMRARGKATEAKVWEGLGFHFKRETIQFGAGILEEKGGTTEHLMPVAFLGERKAGQRKAGRAEAKAEPAEAVDPELVAKLTKMARILDLVKFQAKALEMEMPDELLNAVLDESETGFWTKARS